MQNSPTLKQRRGLVWWGRAKILKLWKVTSTATILYFITTIARYKYTIHQNPPEMCASAYLIGQRSARFNFFGEPLCVSFACVGTHAALPDRLSSNKWEGCAFFTKDPSRSECGRGVLNWSRLHCTAYRFNFSFVRLKNVSLFFQTGYSFDCLASHQPFFSLSQNQQSFM